MLTFADEVLCDKETSLYMVKPVVGHARKAFLTKVRTECTRKHCVWMKTVANSMTMFCISDVSLFRCCT